MPELLDPATLLLDVPEPKAAGAVPQLQRSMARFSNGERHRSKRADVVAAIANLDPTDFHDRALKRTASWLPSTPAEIDAMLPALTVPTTVLAETLGLNPDSIGPAVAAFCDAVALGDGSGAEAAAVLSAVGVTAASLLFQAHDATAALIAGALRHGGIDAALHPCPPVHSTRRVDRTGAELVVGLRGLPFGHGPHACPGRDLALALASGVLAALSERAFVLAEQKITLRPRQNMDLPVRLFGQIS